MSIILGIDHGNGSVKGKSAVKEITLPSIIARPDSFGEAELAGTKKLRLASFESTKHAGEVYMWGKDIRESNDQLATYGSENRYGDKHYQLLSEFAAASLLPNGKTFEDVVVVTGCPSRERNNPELVQQLENVFKGIHGITIDSIKKMFDVSEVYVLPQPMGTIMSLYLDDAGYVVDEDYETKYVGVIDIGSGTTDIDGIKALRRQNDDIDSIPMGMMDAYKKIADYINLKNSNALATAQKVEQQITSDSFKISDRASVDIAEKKQQVFQELAESLINKIKQRWSNRTKFDRLLLTGGGAVLLGDYFKSLAEDIIVVPDAQFANARGFYRYGVLKTSGE
ncbi:plasmid segregation protein ParM domain-containing protein (plasmid) [Aneurinibacillus thermoaerophilus]|uniref:Plasmid segregation protein ParM n=1 Tax=Aneurinibacillus thermoaerophilus TaxID=143495 RepID=A0ABX8YFY2_ANETH|nr:plasmid segregation protein ParM domain-containing protein [Aneurinibacillus thermoaerophilus]QYY44717.1 plasmid segregation protein ParM [Aneurinibacillus thermoaerophilus]